jgi:hypothetical protein
LRAAASDVGLINASSDVGLVNDDASCHDKNGPLNNVPPCRGGSLTKSRGGTKRKSPFRGLGRVLCPSSAPPSPPALRPMHRITSSPPLECSGISNGFFGEALTFATSSTQHTVNQLQRWAKEPDLGVKSFTSSILWMSRSICLLGDARQMVGGSTNKLTAAGFNRADKKASTFNAAKFYLVGNNSTGANMFGRNKKFQLTSDYYRLHLPIQIHYP